MRFLRGIFLLSLFLLSIFPSVLALTIPERSDGYVSDYARLLSSETKDKLDQRLKDYETKTSNQVVVAIFQGLEGESLEDFSIHLAEKWKPGQKGRNNGVIFLVFKDDRKMRIEVGYGLEGPLPDALAGQIIQQVVAPYFKQGQYDEGVLAGVDAIIQATEGEFKAVEKQEGNAGDIEAFLRIVFMILSVLFFIDTTRYAYYALDHRVYPHRYNFLEWFFIFSILLLLLKLIFRILFETAVSSRGGYYGNRSGSGGFSGGGGGGFSGGGGSFGGGGASGGW